MASIKIINYTSKTLSNGEHPIMLRVTKNRKCKYISLDYSCLPKYWSEKDQCFKKSFENAGKRNSVLAEQKSKALKIIDAFRGSGTDFTLNQFAEAFRGNKLDTDISVYDFFQEKIALLKLSNKMGNYKVYSETCKSFFGFKKNKRIRFQDITLSVLDRYEAFLRSRGGTGGGISVKMRTIRALYNDAIKKGYAHKESYPFTNYDFSKLKRGAIKKALTREEVRRIEAIPLEEHPHLIDARHYFVFSYYTRGMNFVDMMNLKWSDIYNDRITYIRAKTGKPFVIKILPPVQNILNYYKEFDRGTKYVFPILLKDNLTANQIANRKTKVLKQFNKLLKEIGKIAEIQAPLTSYVARHSFATNMKQVGVSIAVISESLGHANQEVTETYLKAFENDIIDDAAEKLL